MARLAFVSPVPPAPTGIADYAADVLRLLASRHEIDVFHDQSDADLDAAGCAVHPASSLLARHAKRPYDLAIHQLGNAPAHDFVYPLLARLPGLLVLHDLVLHHARARIFLDSPEARVYRADPSDAHLRDAAEGSRRAYAAEVAYAYPDAAPRIVEAQLGTIGDLLPYAYPLFRLPVEASRATAVHNRAMAETIAAEVPGTAVVEIPMPMTAAVVPAGATARVRSALGLADEAFVVGCFGLVTREKRLETVARAVARAAGSVPRIRLMVVGPVPDPAALEAALLRAGVRDRAVVAGRVPMGALPAHMEAADVVVHLRYPTARETSAALLRVLAQGRPTVTADLDNAADIPADAALRVDVADEEGAVTRALLRLAARPDLRAAMGAKAAAFVRRAHAPAATLAAYERAIQVARDRPSPPPRNVPAHWYA